MSSAIRVVLRAVGSLAAASLVLAVAARRAGAAPEARLKGCVPAGAIARARLVGPLPPGERLSLVIALPMRNKADYDERARRVSDRNDPLYGRFLTPDEFAARYGPTQADYDAVVAFARARGLTVTAKYPNRMTLGLAATARIVERAFRIRLLQYRAADGRVFYAPDREPSVPAPVAQRITGVLGLDNAVVLRPLRTGTGRVVRPTTIPAIPKPE